MAPTSFSQLTLFAAASPTSLERFAPEIIAGVIAVIVLMVALIYVRQLNARHAALLEHLQSELAERRKAEDALRDSEGFYHSLVESLPAAILRKNMSGEFTFGNQKFYAALEIFHKDQLVGKSDLDFFPKVLAEKYRADDRRVIEDGTPLEAVEEHVTPHGEKLYVQVIKTPLRDSLGTIVGVQGIFWDVTERKRAEEQLVSQNIRLQEMAESERQANAALKQAQSQLVQQEKLASLGLIVAGVAHEVNNPVAFVTNNVAVLGRDVGEMRDLIELYEQANDVITRENPGLSTQIQEFRDRVDMGYTLANIQGLLTRSRDGLKRIQQIVSHLRLFAHLDEGDINEADLNDGIESTSAIIEGNARRKHVRLIRELSPLPMVTCHAARINQVVLNLLTNAIDATPEGGTVTVRSGPEEQGVRIEVVDTGCGIDPKVKDRIFDPFFTTKPIGAGTGLGLSISYGIVKDHGGTIDVESAPGAGARFVVHLPWKAPKSAGGRRGSEGDRVSAQEPPRPDREVSRVPG
jgi:two-component system, NtrC family, sensor kinase